jgi:hypothetical protein
MINKTTLNTISLIIGLTCTLLCLAYASGRHYFSFCVYIAILVAFFYLVFIISIGFKNMPPD